MSYPLTSELYCAVCLVSEGDPNRLTTARTMINGTAVCVAHAATVWRFHYPQAKVVR